MHSCADSVAGQGAADGPFGVPVPSVVEVASPSRQARRASALAGRPIPPLRRRRGSRRRATQARRTGRRGRRRRTPASAHGGGTSTPVTAGRPSQVPHCPARTWIENAQPAAEGRNGSGSRSVAREGRSDTWGSPGKAVVQTARGKRAGRGQLPRPALVRRWCHRTRLDSDHMAEGHARCGVGGVAAHVRGRGDHARRLPRLCPPDHRSRRSGRCSWRRSRPRCSRSSRRPPTLPHRCRDGEPAVDHRTARRNRSTP
jgi:hypothetical protein